MAAPGIPSPGSTPGTATGIPATPGFQHPFVTPSPYYNNSIASTGWTSKPAVSFFINPFLRFFGMVSSFIVIFSLVTGNNKSRGAESFRSSAEFRFLLIVNCISVLYSTIQSVKGVWDIAFKCSWISDAAHDYITFILDQIVTYLMLSSASASSTFLHTYLRRQPKLGNYIAAICLSFMTFVVMIACSCVSGYRLCKRMSW